MEPGKNDLIIKKSISLARKWQKRANELLEEQEKQIQKKMARLLNNPNDKVILIKLIDQSFRSSSSKRIAHQIEFILKNGGIPDFFSAGEKLLMKLFLIVGKYFYKFTVPEIIKKMHKDSKRSILPGEKDLLFKHLEKRKDDNVRMNINHLGEAVLGEQEAKKRMISYLADLNNPNIECISIKISTIYSQINSLALEHTLNVLVKRLSKIYNAAQKNYFVRNNGVKVQKSVNLDMEEYKDLLITKEVFIRTLEKQEFKNYSSGIVLQAYIPDSFEIQKQLTNWGKKRVENGGAPIKIRIVKGANMEMETMESSITNWALATYDNKLEVDANYKRMVDYGMEKQNIKAVNLGIASHNLFELAYAYNVAKKNDVIQYFVFEMLEGMADHIRRAIKETIENMLLYAPVAKKDQFINAIAYLVRRLDENTAKENFLRYSYNLQPYSSKWKSLENQFVDSYLFKNKAKNSPNRLQNRLTETFNKKGTFYEDKFINEPDTDFSIKENIKWAKTVKNNWKKNKSSKIFQIPIVVNGKEILKNREKIEFFDLSQIDESKDLKIKIAQSLMADEKDVNIACLAGSKDEDGWREKTSNQRHKILSKVAENIRKARGDLIGSSMSSTGKVFMQADVEVSEAVDFAEFYSFSVKEIEKLKNIKAKGRGLGLVITPWNFPIAIPCGGIVASLAAGNTVILKPASNAVLSAWILCKCFWDAGVSQKTLQFLPCKGSTVGAKLITKKEIDFIILTGGTDTGLKILKEKSDVFLSAETGGKNATIVTAMADKDQAIKNVVESAFGNCGQKCSATSLLVLEKEVYYDNDFKKQLVDAAKSYLIGSVWDYENKIGPMANIPTSDLKKALTKLDLGESWALKPENINNNSYLWTCGIKYGVKQGYYSHITEFFGPVLSVMCADNLDQAIKIINQTGYGLTSGLESLDVREQKIWKNKIKAGNLYINRGTTGAIVLRQPFGGMGKSAIGAGIKAGGFNYVLQFMDFEERKKTLPSMGVIKEETLFLRLAKEWQIKLNWGQFKKEIAKDIQKSIYAIESYIYNAEKEFFMEKDYFNLMGQDNICRYLSLDTIVVRISEKDSVFETIARIACSQISRAKTIISIPETLNNKVIEFLKSINGKKLINNAEIIYETDKALSDKISSISRIRYAAPDRVPEKILKKAAKHGFYIARNKVLQEGRIELLNYFKEQSICDNYHRYGNLGERTV